MYLTWLDQFPLRFLGTKNQAGKVTLLWCPGQKTNKTQNKHRGPRTRHWKPKWAVQRLASAQDRSPQTASGTSLSSRWVPTRNSTRCHIRRRLLWRWWSSPQTGACWFLFSAAVCSNKLPTWKHVSAPWNIYETHGTSGGSILICSPERRYSSRIWVGGSWSCWGPQLLIHQTRVKTITPILWSS